MTPYYDDGQISLYHGDCLDVMAGLDERFDLVFTSPPYNRGTMPTGFSPAGHWKPGNASGSGGRGKWKGGVHGGDGADYDSHDDAMPWAEYVAEQHASVRAMFGCLTDVGAVFYEHQARTIGLRLWRPDELIPSELSIRAEVIWARGSGQTTISTCYLATTERILIVAKDGWRIPKGTRGVADVWRFTADSNNPHPCSFPVDLPARAIATTAPNAVLDPYCGSGTTLVAAKGAGVRAVGIEKSERYCEMAVKRLAQGSLFAAAPDVPSLDAGATPQ